jgi:hypothetical protein
MALQEVSKEVVGIHVLLTRSLFAGKNFNVSRQEGYRLMAS